MEKSFTVINDLELIMKRTLLFIFLLGCSFALFSEPFGVYNERIESQVIQLDLLVLILLLICVVYTVKWGAIAMWRSEKRSITKK